MNVKVVSSTGWIDKIKKRTGTVLYKSIKSESKSVKLQKVEEWQCKISELISGYQPKDFSAMFYHINDMLIKVETVTEKNATNNN